MRTTNAAQTHALFRYYVLPRHRVHTYTAGGLPGPALYREGSQDIRCVVYRYQAPFVGENVGVVEFARPYEGEVGLFGRELLFELFEGFGRVPGLAELAVDRRRLWPPIAAAPLHVDGVQVQFLAGLQAIVVVGAAVEQLEALHLFARVPLEPPHPAFTFHTAWPSFSRAPPPGPGGAAPTLPDRGSSALAPRPCRCNPGSLWRP
jgi:hypothetical protein